MNTATATPVDTKSHAITGTILVADKFEESGLQSLRALGHMVISEPDLTPESLPDAIKTHQPNVLVVRSTKVRADSLLADARLAVVVRAGAGTDNIDLSVASERGIFVSNCPGRNSVAVAEVVWGLILSCDRRIPDQVADLRAGNWKKKEFAKAQGLWGRTLGIVGLGQIGREVATRAHAFGMRVIAWSRSLDEATADKLGVDYCESLVNLARMADVVSVNVSATSETEKLIDAEFLNALKPGAYFINSSRGTVVDQEALTKVIQDNGVRAGLDVFANEPAASDKSFTDPIVNESGVYGTHHVGASTEQAQKAIADEAIRIIRNYLETGEIINCVNLASETGAATLTVRHLNRPGVLAHVFDLLGQAGINVEDMENVIYTGGEAACARISLAATPSPGQLQRILANEHVLDATILPKT
ncbi:MAG: 3-phosphoglycerate dehydrogenase family protein [Phycisphaerales bacterium]|nr:3-phosphoglycerate dehydrogenase family protein [Phycisphaerales bacterium]